MIGSQELRSGVNPNGSTLPVTRVMLMNVTPTLLFLILLIGLAAPPLSAQETSQPLPTDQSLQGQTAETAQDETGEAGAGAPLSATDKIVKRFMELDVDATATVSFEEYMTMVKQRAEERFKSMDADADGEVTEDEYRAFWLARKAQWYRLKQ